MAHERPTEGQLCIVVYNTEEHYMAAPRLCVSCIGGIGTARLCLSLSLTLSREPELYLLYSLLITYRNLKVPRILHLRAPCVVHVCPAVPLF